jgi:hypothetical protein
MLPLMLLPLLLLPWLLLLLQVATAVVVAGAAANAAHAAMQWPAGVDEA